MWLYLFRIASAYMIKMVYNATFGNISVISYRDRFIKRMSDVTQVVDVITMLNLCTDAYRPAMIYLGKLRI